MKASDILDKVNNLRPNPYGSYLGDYLKSFDIRIREDLLCESGPTYDEENLALDYEYFTVYELFLFSVIDLLNGEYGIDDVCLSLLNVVGNKGAHSKIMLPLNDVEIEALHNSAKVLKDLIKGLNI